MYLRERKIGGEGGELTVNTVRSRVVVVRLDSKDKSVLRVENKHLYDIFFVDRCFVFKERF